jgi:polysaccharide pyruvyl transferase WcaK-like protein
MRLVLFNLKHGTNLGDRLIADCLERELQAQDPTIEVTHADLAGRTQPGTGGGRRRLALGVLENLPRPLRRLVATVALRRLERRHLRPFWRRLLADADAVVLGGGQLLADHDLNFPIKVSAALDEASARHLPVAVYALGVACGWSTKGRTLFGEALSRSKPIFSSVRDQRSFGCWSHQLGPFRVAPPSIVVDPAMLTVRHFPNDARNAADAPVALCITSPRALSYHDGGHDMPAAIDDWYVALVRELAGRNHPLRIFSAGAPEDAAFLDRLAPRLLEATAQRCVIDAALNDTATLAKLIADCRVMIAHRLHACLPAASYGIPFIGLAWDPKMQALFEMLGVPERLVSPARSSAVEIADLVDHVIAAGVDRAVLSACVEQASQDVAALVGSLRKATGGNGV